MFSCSVFSVCFSCSEYETQKAKISLIDHDKAKINLVEPNYRVAPGQACVIYLKDRVLGGGWIT